MGWWSVGSVWNGRKRMTPISTRQLKRPSMPRKSTIRLKRTICDRSYTKQRRGRQTHPHAWGLFVGVLLTGCQTQSAVSTQTVDATYPSYEEIHLVRADALGTCRQGIAYQPDFGAVKRSEE